MKTPTLIVRLVGLHLVVQNTVALIQAQRFNSMGGIGLAQQQIVGDIRFHSVVGLLVGLAATAYAGRLARILTLDADRE